MAEMRMDRRSFLKGMLGISVAVAVLPLLPGPEVVAEASILAPIIEFPNPASILGRLGRVRIDKTWFPLEDASFTMFRRHAPKVLYMPGSRYGEYLQVNKEYLPIPLSTSGQGGNLVNSPWQVEIWTPDEEIRRFFGNPKKLEFEFNTRMASFVGHGFLTQMESEIRNIQFMPEEGAPPALFSVRLEGDTKLRRFGDVSESDFL